MEKEVSARYCGLLVRTEKVEYLVNLQGKIISLREKGVWKNGNENAEYLLGGRNGEFIQGVAGLKRGYIPIIESKAREYRGTEIKAVTKINSLKDVPPEVRWLSGIESLVE